jgi:Kdo2-lipid IVA lauroyltransferase/acyltransferase
MARKTEMIRRMAEYVAMRVVLATLAWTPRLAGFYVSLLDRAVPKLRRAGEQNLAMAFPSMDPAERQRILDGVFRSIARLLVTFSRFRGLNRQNISQWIRYEGREHFDQALSRGKGVLFATAHFGNWELSAFAHALLAAPMHVVVRPLDNPLIDHVVEGYRTLSGNSLITKKDYARSILKALAANEAVGILIDQDAGLEGSTFIDFFGAPASAGLGFARLAAHSRATVIPGYALWSDAEQRYILKFDQPIEITGDAIADTQRIHAHLEQVIREHPDQWLWIHRRWKTRPPT